MRFLKIAGLSLLGLVVLLAVVGFLLPGDWSVARSRVIAAPANRVHPYVADLAKWPLWCPFDREDPAMVMRLGARTTGAGAERSWTSEKMGSGAMRIDAADPSRGVSIVLTMEGGFPPFDVDFTYEPVEGGAKTNVTWASRGKLRANPMDRWMGVLMGPMMSDVYDRGLADLEAAVLAGK